MAFGVLERSIIIGIIIEKTRYKAIIPSRHKIIGAFQITTNVSDNAVVPITNSPAQAIINAAALIISAWKKLTIAHCRHFRPRT